MKKLSPQEKRNLTTLIRKFLATLDDKKFDEWYTTPYSLNFEIFKDFKKWIKLQEKKL
jgi:hypothetical protein